MEDEGWLKARSVKSNQQGFRHVSSEMLELMGKKRTVEAKKNSHMYRFRGENAV